MANTDFVRSVNDIALFIGGAEFILEENYGEDIQMPLEVVSGAGDIKGAELVPTTILYRLTLNGYMKQTELLHDLEIVPDRARDRMINRSFDIEIYDRESGELLAKYPKAKCEAVTTDLRKHNLYMRNARFVSVDGQPTW